MTAKQTAVTPLLDEMAHPLRPVIDAMRAIVRDAVPQAAESIKWNAPSFATAEHFATFHLRRTTEVQLVLHLGAKPRTDVDMRRELPEVGTIATWKGPDRAVVTVQSLEQVQAMRETLVRLIRAWSDHVAAS